MVDVILCTLYMYIVLQSYREFKEADVETWMKSVNIDIYWDFFKQGGITSGKALAAVIPETLVVSLPTELYYFHYTCTPQLQSLQPQDTVNWDALIWKFFVCKLFSGEHNLSNFYLKNIRIHTCHLNCQIPFCTLALLHSWHAIYLDKHNIL